MAYQEIQELSKIFDQIDKDKTGFINVEELQAAMKQSGFEAQTEEIQKII